MIYFRNTILVILTMPVYFAATDVSSWAQDENTEVEMAEESDVTPSVADRLLDETGLLEQLAAEESEMTEAINNLTARLASLGDDVDNAEAIFDEMVAAVERQAALGDPEGNFIEEVEALIEQANALQIEARELGDVEAVNDIELSIRRFEAAREAALSLHADSFRALREIRAQRGRFVLRIRARLLTEAAAVAEAGVARMREFNERVNEIRDSIEPDDTEIVPE